MFIPFRIYHPSIIPDLARMPPVAPLLPLASATPGPMHHPNYLSGSPIVPLRAEFRKGEQIGYLSDVFAPPALPWTESSPPRSMSPQHQFYFDEYSDVRPQYTPTSDPPV